MLPCARWRPFRRRLRPPGGRFPPPGHKIPIGALVNNLLDGRIYRLPGCLRIQFRHLSIGKAVAFQHVLHLGLPRIRLLIALCCHVEELLGRKAEERRDIPLAVHKELRCKQIRILRCGDQHCHAAHGLPGGVDSVRIHRIRILHRGDKIRHQIHVFGCRVRAVIVIQDRNRKGGHQNDARVLCLLLLGSPDKTSPALGEGDGRVIPGCGGVADKHHHRVGVGGIVVLRKEEVVINAKTRCLIGVGQDRKLIGERSDHVLQLCIRGLVGTAGSAAGLPGSTAVLSSCAGEASSATVRSAPEACVRVFASAEAGDTVTAAAASSSALVTPGSEDPQAVMDTRTPRARSALYFLFVICFLSHLDLHLAAAR